MTTFPVHANLDCEARWANVPLPANVAQRISLYGALISALAPRDRDGDVEVWAPAAVDASRLQAVADWVPPAMRAGTPACADLAWASPEARAVNDRRLALAIGTAHGVALPGARVIERVDELALAGPWICKAPWTAAGRDRCRGAGSPSAEQRTRLARLLARFGSLVLEPWCERLIDVGVCATVATDGTVDARPPHGLLTDRHGNFLGIDLALPALEAHEHDQLATLVAAAGAALAARGYAGPFAIDAFAYVDEGVRRFQPLCEINARYSFGWIARAFAARCGTRRLGFATPPAGARVLIRPADDHVTAWIA